MKKTTATATGLTKTLSAVPSTLSESFDQKVHNLTSRFQSYESFNQAFGPDTQAKMARDERHAIMADYSTLETLNFAFGANAASSWLTTHIANLNKFAGSKNMSDPQTKELAQIIAQEYKNIKFSILMLFFYRFKLGDFGKFFGKIDPMVITCSLKDFVASCREKMFLYQEEEFLARQREETRIRDEVSLKWFEFHQALCHRSQSKEQRQAFESIYLYHVDVEKRSLLLAVSKEVSELNASKYLDYLTPLWRDNFPEFSLDYRLIDSKPVLPSSSHPPFVNLTPAPPQVSTPKEAKTVRNFANSIIDLQEKYGEPALQNISSTFQALFGSKPEDFGTPKSNKAPSNNAN